jgi:hypothetical protein
MGLAGKFDAQLKKKLEELVPEYEWTAGWSAKDEQWKVDVAGELKNGRRRVLIEAELKKDNPLGNVVKIWQWAQKREYKDNLVFIQGFSEHYQDRGRKIMHRKRATFVGKQMGENKTILYKDCDLHYKPLIKKGHVSKKGGGRTTKAAKRLAVEVASILHSL